ncbi:hypothetical protein XM53_00960 [Roseovarius atlanticus]|uniref:Uncharacterized protein n=1 Tax=Roseovarius atlanticus TaxID=1641875 RepID=A0A0T5NZL5_9RHOB|nr:hypothetical protein [Roseovarius atlanticus]KRS14334.1 hypothetical protein XM53_00960 [Roseovarius atlanticus]
MKMKKAPLKKRSSHSVSSETTAKKATGQGEVIDVNKQMNDTARAKKKTADVNTKMNEIAEQGQKRKPRSAEELKMSEQLMVAIMAVVKVLFQAIEKAISFIFGVSVDLGSGFMKNFIDEFKGYEPDDGESLAQKQQLALEQEYEMADKQEYEKRASRSSDLSGDINLAKAFINTRDEKARQNLLEAASNKNVIHYVEQLDDDEKDKFLMTAKSSLRKHFSNVLPAPGLPAFDGSIDFSTAQRKKEKAKGNEKEYALMFDAQPAM